MRTHAGKTQRVDADDVGDEDSDADADADAYLVKMTNPSIGEKDTAMMPRTTKMPKMGTISMQSRGCGIPMPKKMERSPGA